MGDPRIHIFTRKHHTYFSDLETRVPRGFGPCKKRKQMKVSAAFCLHFNCFFFLSLTQKSTIPYFYYLSKKQKKKRKKNNYIPSHVFIINIIYCNITIINEVHNKKIGRFFTSKHVTHLTHATVKLLKEKIPQKKNNLMSLRIMS